MTRSRGLIFPVKSISCHTAIYFKHPSHSFSGINGILTRVVSILKEVVILSKDRVGILADISYFLGNEGINIEQVSVNVIDDKAVVNLAISDADYRKAKQVLHSNGYETLADESIIVKINDTPGSLAQVSRKLADNKINLLNMHSIGKSEGYAYMSLSVDKPEQAKKILENILQKA